jgi:hypothetical protein
MTEPAGTVLLGSLDKRAYLYVSQSAERMEIERQNARSAGVQDVRDFVFELDGERIELDYRTLKKRLRDEDKQVLLALVREGIACGGSTRAFLRWVERAKFITSNEPPSSALGEEVR